MTTVEINSRKGRIGAVIRRGTPTTYPLTADEWQSLKRVGIATTAFVFGVAALGCWLAGLL